MGFAVDQEIITLASDEGMYAEFETSRWWESPWPFVALAKLVAADGATCLYAHGLVALWRDVLTSLPDGAAALLIAHSGDLEAALVACFPKADHAAWGAPFGLCDGNPPRFTNVAILRQAEFVG
jgi:hypothetical protein